jgi:cytochrome oxidase Cu insertion factor (SCO1/SenC/PrrC family)
MGKKLAFSFATLSSLIYLFLILLTGTWGFIKYGHTTHRHTFNAPKDRFFFNPITPTSALELKTITGQPFDTTPLRGKWVIVYFNNTPCVNNYCDHYLNTLLAIKQKFRTENESLIGAWLKNTSAINLANPDNKQLKLMNIDNTQLSPDHFYIIDPLGNVILSYNDDISPEAVLADLQKLTRVSRL